MLKKLLIFMALAEGATGLILCAYPPIIVWLLFGRDIAISGLIMGRLAGLCLVALAVSCWPRGGSQSGFYGMLAYGVLAALFLILVGASGTSGILLWPMVGVHVLLVILLVRARAVTRNAQSIA